MNNVVRWRHILLAALVVPLIALLLFGSVHHHDGDSTKTCWYCVAATAGILPAAVPLLSLPLLLPQFRGGMPLGPLRSARIPHHRRGPPPEPSAA